MADKKDRSKDIDYCEFAKCNNMGCLIRMSGETCYSLGLVEEHNPGMARKYEEWLKENK